MYCIIILNIKLNVDRSAFLCTWIILVQFIAKLICIQEILPIIDVLIAISYKEPFKSHHLDFVCNIYYAFRIINTCINEESLLFIGL